MGKIEITEDAIYIYDAQGGEVVSWTISEFEEDTGAAMTALNAVHIFHEEGVEWLKVILDK